MLIAPLFPTKLHSPAFSLSLCYTSTTSFSPFLTSTAECRPPIVSVAAIKYPSNTYTNISSHSFFDQQQKARHSERWHSCVPKQMTSGAGQNDWDLDSSTRELIGGREPKRFQVIARTVSFSWEGLIGSFVFCSDYYFIIQIIRPYSKKPFSNVFHMMNHCWCCMYLSITTPQTIQTSLLPILKYLPNIRLIPSSICELISAFQFSSFNRSKFKISSHSHYFQMTQIQQQMSWRNYYQRTQRSYHQQFIIAQICCFFILGLEYFQKRSQSSQTFVNQMLELSWNQQISHPHSWSNFIFRVSFRLPDQTSAMRSIDNGMPFQMAVIAQTTKLPLICTPVQLGTHLFQKQNISFQMPYPFQAYDLSRDFSQKIHLCILLKSYFLGRGRAKCRQCWQYCCRYLKEGWHLQGRRWICSQKSSSYRQQFSISFRKLMKDSLNLCPVYRMYINGLLISITQY